MMKWIAALLGVLLWGSLAMAQKTTILEVSGANVGSAPHQFECLASVPGGNPGACAGTVWVKDNSPTELFFTNSSGVDIRIDTVAGVHVSSSVINSTVDGQLMVWDGTGGLTARKSTCAANAFNGLQCTSFGADEDLLFLLVSTSAGVAPPNNIRFEMAARPLNNNYIEWDVVGGGRSWYAGIENNVTGNGGFVIKNAVQGALENGRDAIRIDNANAMFFDEVNFDAAAAGTTLAITGGGEIRKLSSSKRYKHAIKDIEGSERIYDLRAVNFVYNYTPDVPMAGLIAEEVDKVMPEYVLRKDDGVIESVSYNSIMANMLAEMQKLHARVVELEKGNNQ